MTDSILTLVTFLPTLGAVLLMLMPRNDRLLRMDCAAASLATFAISLFLPLNFIYGLHLSGQTGFQFETNHAVDRQGHPLPHGSRWHIHVAGPAHHVPGPVERAGELEINP